jgi:hypothetical protein
VFEPFEHAALQAFALSASRRRKRVSMESIMVAAGREEKRVVL